MKKTEKALTLNVLQENDPYVAGILESRKKFGIETTKLSSVRDEIYSR